MYTQGYDIYSRVFVTACAIRAMFPRKYIERICLIETWLSYPFVGRLAATLGEIAFAYQLYRVTNQPAIVYLSIVAQFFCWAGIITTHYQWHVYEEIIWLMIGTICATSSSVAVASFAFVYCLFMYFVDIPMYQSRHVKDEASNKTYLSWKDGWMDTLKCYPNRDYAIWRPEMVWMLGIL